MPLSWNEIKSRAIAFSRTWADESSEHAEAKSFWDDFFNILINPMANTYTQCHVHLVFAVKHRKALIQKSWKADLEKYITGIVQNYDHKLLAIGGMPDHIHIFLGYNVKHLLPNLVSEIKTSSNAWIQVLRT